MKGAVVFDLDGTLVDSLPDIAGALNVWLATRGAPAVAVAAVRGMMGDPARELVAVLLSNAGFSGSQGRRFLSLRSEVHTALLEVV
jgi:phosphoglycolate phosphatase